MELKEILKFVAGLDLAIDQLEPELQPMVAKLVDELMAGFGSSKQDQLAKIELLNNYTYTLVSLIFSYLKAKGENTDAHPIKNELVRIQGYMKRAKQLELQQEDEEEKEEKRKEQARAFIEQTLGVKLGHLAPEDLAKPAISESNFANDKETSREKTTEENPTSDNGKQTKAKLKGKPRQKTKPNQLGKIAKPRNKKK